MIEIKYSRHNLLFKMKILICVFILLSSLRGGIVVTSGISPEIIYYPVAFVLLLLSFYGLILRYSFKGCIYIRLRNLMIINLILGVVAIFVDMFLGQSIDFSVFYIYLAPYFVFLVLKVPKIYLDKVILIIALILSFSIIDNFIISIQGMQGQSQLLEYNQKLRPELESISRTGEFLRVGGYTGNPHDAGNVLGITLIYLMLSFFLNRKISFLIGAIFSLISLLLTQSAVNIILSLLLLSIFTFLTIIKLNKIKYIIPIIFSVMAMFLVMLYLGDLAWIFTKRIDTDADWSGMLRGLQSSNYSISVAHLILGHATAFGSEHIYTEVALLKMLFELGLFHWGILLLIFNYPLLLYIKFNRRAKRLFIDAFPALGSLLFGFASLLHYGSVLRVTSVFLFYTIFAIALRAIDNHMNVSALK